MPLLTPWRTRGDLHPFASLQDEVGRALERLMKGEVDFGGLLRRNWEPALDVSETDDDVIVKAEVPGIDPKDLDIRVTGDVLTIKGEKHEEKEEKTKEVHRVERSYGAFTRSIDLPEAVDAEKIKAECRGGVLTITLPKKPEAKSHRIKIEVK